MTLVMKRLPIILSAAILLFAACAPDRRGLPSVSVEGLEDLAFPAEGGTRTFTVLSDNIWTLSKDSLDWVSLSVPAGNADEKSTITLTVPKNETPAERSGKLILGSGEFRKSYEVHQDFGAFVRTSAASVTLPSVQEEAALIHIVSNVDWSLDGTLPEWLRIRPSEGLAGESVVSVWADDNKADESRGFDFILSSGQYKGLATVPIRQEGLNREPFLAVVGTTKDTVYFDPEPALTEIVVSTNCDWTVEGVPDWLAMSRTAGTAQEGDIALSLLPTLNAGRSEKEATLTFIADNPGVPPVNVIVWQEGNTIKTQMLARWTVSSNDQMKKEWPDYVIGASGALVNICNSVPMASSTNPDATLQFVYAPTYSARSKFRTAISNVRFIVFYFCIDDAFVFTVPDVTAYEGMKLNLRTRLYPYTMYTVKSYVVEFLDGAEWKQAEGKGSELTFYHPQSSSDKELDDGNINATYTLKRDFISETVTFRVRAVTNESIRGDKNTNSSGRLELGANTELKELSVWLLAE